MVASHTTEKGMMLAQVPEQQTTLSLLRAFDAYAQGESKTPLFLCRNAVELLAGIPKDTIDCCMTSPPYWGHRQYAGGGIGIEKDYRDYIKNLLPIFAHVHRVLKPTGSFWLNLGDAYEDKRLLGIPWRVALKLMDEQGWVLRNSVVWNKVKGGPDNTDDRLRNVHEEVFHFVKAAKGYYYDADAIRANAKTTKVVNGSVITATGVSGVRYRRQIELSTALTNEEKQCAFKALEAILEVVKAGELADFRMVIRGQQRTTHSDSTAVSGRAGELAKHGYYFLRYHPNGSKPSDVWDIIPEDTQGRESHFAPYPEDLCKIPLLATCPPSGIALDPFCGTGTTNLVAFRLGRKSVGVDISEQYIALARQRCYGQTQ